MDGLNSIIVFNNIKLPIDASHKEAFSVAAKRLRAISSNCPTSELRVYRRSIDARHKDDIKFVYSISAPYFGKMPPEATLRKYDCSVISETKPEITIGETPLSAPPVIIGAGPAGLFAALLLSELGYEPVLVERGGSIAERTAAVKRFYRTHILDLNSNIQFGAGGAGTFSDGKLVTRINDPLTAYVLDKFVEFGGPSDIRYIAKPHLGTDILSGIVEKITERIEENGGRVLYNTRMLYPKHSLGRVTSVVTDKGEIPCGALILAIGHSARDTQERLVDEGFSVEAKSFSVGMRIEHPASLIDESMYGSYAGHPALGHAEYNLAYNTKVRGVYTFCMCPGGEVVAAASEEGGVVVNGMSYHSRSGKNSNSAVVCSVFKEDYGNTPKAAIDFQRKIEQKAFIAGGGNFRAPIITVGDFLSGKCSREPSVVSPTYMNGDNVTLRSPEEYLPSVVTDSIKRALVDFDRKISGFASDFAVLTGAETRTSSPIRITRDRETCLAIGFDNLFPSGEGAGYAGGITSAAIDGLRCAMALMKIFKPR